VVYNPSANGILASGSGDHVVRIWDTDSRGSGLENAVIELKGHRDTIQSLSWNYTGDLLITVSISTSPLFLHLQAPTIDFEYHPALTDLEGQEDQDVRPPCFYLADQRSRWARRDQGEQGGLVRRSR
jgi:hypothetical protein